MCRCRGFFTPEEQVQEKVRDYLKKNVVFAPRPTDKEKDTSQDFDWFHVFRLVKVSYLG